ncbi:MAG: nucleoside-diphosphate kinase [Candidatus Poseidoniia archaeon]|uniref:Nucleoside diphosphate kinase n=1 Tax=Marine Group III euryarchaeote TaxID=2173149 RepID=A0A7C7ZFJ9_9ARCH|nr:MAG: nucleoside-diphosphate kinase [Euryarchaeota archaeon]HIG63160.1 nucleoside-diphosphate kinase [Marine Group III euryarchaeote]HIL33683.1 nucleoside-diphosphate kinase [Candidatus Poseidoniales archaeon]
MSERTYVMLKPDAVRRGFTGRILQRFEDAGLQMAGMQRLAVSEAQSKALYAEHEGKPFYDSLLIYIHSGPVVATVWEGTGAVALARKLIGATDPAQAAPGTIRGDFGLVMDENVVHGSDSAESAEREIPIFFPGLD